MTGPAVWTEEIQIRSFETDFQERWKPASFFQTMQETATHHADSLGFGYRAMINANAIWILARVKIVFHRFPCLGDRLTVHTWPKGLQQRLFFMRDFTFTSGAGDHLADATSAWVMFDPAARRLLPPRSFTGTLPDNDGRSALDEELGKIDLPADLPERLQVQAGYSAVDLMGHVNNARYIEWAMDCLPLADLQARSLRSIQINFLNEVKPGERVAVQAGPLGEQWVAQGLNLDSGARAFEVAIAWS